MKKQIPALVAAFLITGFITLAMVVTSANALLNKNSVAVSNVPTAAASNAAVSSSSLDQAQIQQLQARITEYQQREQQYQQQVQQAQQQIQSDQAQLQQAALQAQQFQQFLQALQERGIIRIQQDGSILITARGHQ